MVVLIILNIILIIAFVSLLVYIFANKSIYDKNHIKNEVCEKEKDDDEDDEEDDDCDTSEQVKSKKIRKIKIERVFDGRIVTDEEYQHMLKSRRSDISILLEEVKRDYEHLKELNK